PAAVKLRRRHLDSLERVERLWSDDPAVRAETAAWFAGFHGFQPADLVRTAGVGPDQAEPLVGRLTAAGRLTELTLPPARRLVLHADRIAELEDRLLDALRVL